MKLLRRAFWTILVLGIAYAVCAVIPGVFIPERMYDPKAVDAGGETRRALA